MPHRSSTTLPLVLAAAMLMTTSCGGGPDLIFASRARNRGPSATAYAVSNGNVTAYRVATDGSRGSVVGTATTDQNGVFQLKLPQPTTGPLLISVSSGTYVEPATGTTVNLSGGEITAIAASQVHVAGDVISGVLVSPVSHLVAQVATRRVRIGGLTVDAALKQASDLLNSHFGGIDWQALGSIPDLTNGKAGIVQLNNETKAAIILVGLSMEARNLSVPRGLTAGGALNSFTLLTALANDLAADGFFDGVGGGGKLALPAGAANAYTLDGQTVRGTLASAIRDFLSSNRNASQVTGADADPGVLAIATDGNPQLFRDNGVGPALSVGISFVGGDGKTHSPVGPSTLVAGKQVQITVDANGFLPTQAIAVSAGSDPVPPGPGSTATHFVATWDSTAVPSGVPASFTAIGTDIHGNPTTTTFTVTPDNEAPTFTTVSPSSPVYAADGIDVNVVAEEPIAGVLSVTQTGFDGLVNSDSSGARFVGHWTFPGDTPDGLAEAQFTACSQVFVCATTIVSVNVDRTPPSIGVAAGNSVPRYTNVPQLAVLISATDVGSGVAEVWFQLGAAAPLPALLTPDGWVVSARLQPGDNSLQIWGIDRVRNTGENKGLFSPSFTVTFSATPPNIFAHAMPSYFSELGMTLQTVAGIPVVPPAFQYANLAKDDLTKTSSIFKAATRLSGPSDYVATATDLETQNPYNLPFLAFDVTDPVPLASVTYSLQCPGCTTFSGGALVDSAGVWLAPISSDRLIALATTTAPLPISVLLTAVDAAGNSFTRTATLIFNVIGPPLVVGEDTSYLLYGDPSSAFPYTIASLTYHREFVAQPSFPLGAVRYIRYLVQNPFDQPVVLYQQLSGAWSVTERWVDEVLQHNQFADKFGDSYRADDGELLDTLFVGNIGAPFTLSPPKCFYFPPSASCGPPTAQPQISWHPNGLTSQYACTPAIPPVRAGAATTVVEATAPLSAQVLLNPGIRGNEPAANLAGRTTDNGFIVPAAAGGAPGRAVLYAVRSAAVPHVDELVARV